MIPGPGRDLVQISSHKPQIFHKKNRKTEKNFQKKFWNSENFLKKILKFKNFQKKNSAEK